MAKDRRGAATILLDPEEGTRTWKALLLVTVVRSNARTAVAVESTRMILTQMKALNHAVWLKALSLPHFLTQEKTKMGGPASRRRRSFGMISFRLRRTLCGDLGGTRACE